MSRLVAVSWTGLAMGLVLLAGCDVHFNMGHNYGFTYTGETAETDDGGTIDAAITKVRIVNKFGPVVIRPQGENDEEATWTWHGKVWSPTKEQAEAYTEELLVDVQTEGTTQTWTLLMPESADDLDGVESRLEFVLPPSMIVDLNNQHGDSEVVNMQGELELDQSFGNLVLQQFNYAKVDIRHGEGMIEDGQGDLEFDGAFTKLVVRRMKGNVTCEAQHSEVSVDQVAGDVDLETTFDRLLVDGVEGRARLENAHGDIQANIQGDVEAENRHGDIQLASGGQRVTITGAHGDIQLRMSRTDFAKIDVDTSFGDLLVQLPADAQPTIEMDTRFGETESDFESAAGSAQSRVKLENSHGDIEVRAVAPASTATAESDTAPQADETAGDAN